MCYIKWAKNQSKNKMKYTNSNSTSFSCAPQKNTISNGREKKNAPSKMEKETMKECAFESVVISIELKCSTM